TANAAGCRPLRPADRVSGDADGNAASEIAKGRKAGGVDAQVVAEHPVTRRSARDRGGVADLDAAPGVTRDHVARSGASAADGVVRGILDLHGRTVGELRHARGVRADVIAEHLVAGREASVDVDACAPSACDPVAGAAARTAL